MTKAIRALCLFLTLGFVLSGLACAIIYETQANMVAQTIINSMWLEGWDKRVKITIDHNDIDENLTDFPLLVYLSSSSGRNNDDVTFIFDELQSDANRGKIAVTTKDNTQCYVEIEEWSDANEQAWLWTRVPNVSSIEDTTLYLYYGRGQTDNTNYVGDTGSVAAQQVWDANYVGVWHLSETVGGSGAIKDSTSNNNNGTDYGSPSLGASGLIGNAIDFDGVDDYISIPNSASLQFISSLTVEAWVRLYTFGSGSDVDIILRKGEANPNDYQLAVCNQMLSLKIEENDDQGLHSNISLTANNWYGATGTWNGATRKVYLNGSEYGSASRTGDIVPDTRAIYIGGRSTTDLSNGVIDEVRASNVSRTASWTRASYESGRDDLVDFGLEDMQNRHSLDATGGYMIVGAGTPNWGSVSGTISFWIKWDVVGNRPWGQHGNMELRFSGSNLLLDWGGDASLTSSTSFIPDKWYFIAIVWNESTDQLYIYLGDQDNVPVLDAANNAWTLTVSTVGVTQNNFLASRGGVNPTDGHGDDLRYWNVDRSLVEIQGDYKIELTGLEANLQSYYRLNSNFDDAGSSNNDGTGSGTYSFSTDAPFS